MLCAMLGQTYSADAHHASELLHTRPLLAHAAVTPGSFHACTLHGVLQGGCASADRTHAPLQRQTQGPGRLVAARAAVQARDKAAAAVQDSEEPQARLVAVVADGKLSAVGNTDVTLAEVLAHMARRVAFNNPAFHLKVFTDAALEVPGPDSMLLNAPHICASSRKM